MESDVVFLNDGEIRNLINAHKGIFKNDAAAAMAYGRNYIGTWEGKCYVRGGHDKHEE